jgi:hypothetical protein
MMYLAPDRDPSFGYGGNAIDATETSNSILGNFIFGVRVRIDMDGPLNGAVQPPGHQSGGLFIDSHSSYSAGLSLGLVAGDASRHHGTVCPSRSRY